MLTHLQSSFEAAAKGSDRAEMVRLNAAFHATILGIHPNIEALRLLGYHLAIMNAIRLRFGYAAARLRQIVRDHRALIKCCDLRDAAAAETLMRSHIQDSLRCLSADVSAASRNTSRAQETAMAVGAPGTSRKRPIPARSTRSQGL